MIEKVEQFIQDLMTARDVMRLYAAEHPETLKSVAQAFTSLVQVFNETDELVIGIIGNEFVYENEIFFDLSKRLQSVIAYLKERSIERLVFARGVTKEELSAFINFLMLPVEQVIEDVDTYLADKGIHHIGSGKIKVTGSVPSGKKILVPKNLLHQYQDSLSVVSENIERVIEEEPPDYRNLKATISNVMMNLLGQYQEFLKLGTVKRYDQITFMHMLNVTILAMLFSSKLGFDHDAVMDIGIAALFHDIGKLYVSRKVLTKPGKLGEPEFELIESHTKLGAEMMLPHVRSFGQLPVIVAYEHHIKYNRKGYPKIPPEYEPHPASRLIALCDVYDALTQRRSYKTNYPPETVYNIMKRGRGVALSPDLFDRFFAMMGVWPVGTIVKLSDERIGIVREENADDIFCPMIEIVAPEDKKGRIDLRAHKDAVSIEKSLNVSGEGKPFVGLI